uniref:Uncharacterized protein n=1 Tax=Bos mutus grunniens TaxID=30521 RepID=A0A8C0A6P0_BOSMU
RLCPCKSRPVPPVDQVQGICCHRVLQRTCRSGCQAPKEVATASVGPTSWPSCPSSLCEEATGEQDLQAPHGSLQGDWPLRRGYWGNKICKPHTVPCKVTGRCGSMLVRLILAPRGTGISPPLCPRSCCSWPASTTATLLPGAAPPPWTTSPRPLLMPFPRPTVISPLTSGKRQRSPRFRIRNSLTIL